MSDEPASGTRRALGMRLQEAGLLTEGQLQVGLKEQRRTSEPLGRILVSLGFVREEDLARMLFEDAGVDFVSLREHRPDPTLLERFDLDFLHAHQFVPLAERPEGIDVAMANPSDIYAADSIQQKLQVPVQVKGAVRKEILDVLGREAQRRRANDDSEGEPETEAAVQTVDTLIRQAVELGATDLHIEPEDKLVRIRYRVDGVLTPGNNLPSRLTRALVTRIKILAGLDITESRLPQDGRLSWDGAYGRVDLRVSSLPCVQGETIVCRLLDHSTSSPRVERLGLPEALSRELQELVKMPHGIFLVTGPTGSGKTTTLYSLLATLDPMERKICTVEDPVEYRLPLIRQCQVHADIGLDFSAALRSLLRQDPDVILLGETRDLETAQIAVRASLTGHFVLSTLHTTTALGAISRLADMGVEPFLLASSLAGVLGQRLVRKVCRHCSEPRAPRPDEVALFLSVGMAAPEQVAQGRGCSSCSGRGFQGRTGVYEFVRGDEALREAIAQGVRGRALSEIAARSGTQDMFLHGLTLVAEGVTTPAELLRVIPEAPTVPLVEAREEALVPERVHS